MRGIWQDIRQGGRLMRRSPGFAAVAVATLALGIGANAAVFSLLREALLRPLPLAAPERLVAVFENDRLRQTTRERASFPDFVDFRAQAQSFAALAAWQASDRTLTGAGEPERLVVARVSPNYFQMLQVAPLLGRDLAGDDDRVVLLSEGLWRRRFGGDTGAVGRGLILDGESFTVVGVIPDRARLPFQSEEIWTALVAGERDRFRGVHNTRVYGRLQPGVRVDQAQAEMTAIMSRLERAYPEDNEGRGAVVIPLAELAAEEVRPALLALQAAVGFVLLIGCANVANLLLARAVAREREMKIREWLGAGRRRIARQLLAENLPVAAAGGALGVLLAYWAVDGLRAWGAQAMPGLEKAAVDLRVLGFAAAVTLGAWLLAGVGSWVVGVGGRALVVLETALAMILLVGAGLLLRSFENLAAVDPGFDPRGLVALSVQLPEARYPVPEKWPYLIWPQVTGFQNRLLDQVRALTGVESAALGFYTPMSGGWTTRFTISGRPAPPPGQQEEAHFRVVSEGYFETTRVAVGQGRPFLADDDERHPKVAVVNESFARRYLAGEAALGMRVRMYGVEREIVGVAANEKFLGLSRETPPAVYLPYRQNPLAGITLVVRSAGDPLRLAPALERTIRSLDADLAVYDVMGLEKALDATLSPRRFTMGLVTGFAGTALALAVLGVAAVLGFAMSRRRREIGVRIAVGATPRAVERLVVGEGLRLVGLGALLGLLAALGLMRFLESQLFGVGAWDPGTLAAAVAVLLLAALLASWVPARRAARTDPVVALRSE
jgi:ABC-type antimicrobial peptide transport system permease subunit